MEDWGNMLLDLEDVEPLKAPFIWQGGKTKSLKHLMDHIPYTKVYVEPFGGSGAVLLARRASKLEVFNDRNSGLIDFYLALKGSRFEELMETIRYTLSSRELFAKYQGSYIDTKDPIERAAMWFYLQQTSFAGLGRSWGRATSHKVINANKIHKNLPDFPAIHDRLKNVQIENLDFEKCLVDYDSPETVFYLDPPYLNTKNLYTYEWTRDDQLRLLKRIFECEGTVILSGYTEPLNDLFPFDYTHSWEANSTIRNDDTLTHSERENIWVKQA